MLHFKLNDFLKLELSQGKTKIFIKNKEFKFYCKPLILTIEVDKKQDYDEIKSIDDTVNFTKYEESKKIIIPPEQEFWGHCSNLQVWIENNYNLNYIHTNLGFPLLRALYDAGDSKAMRVFKDELAKRFCSKSFSVANYLFEEGYLDYFNKEEFESIINFYKDLSKENNSDRIMIWVILSICFQQIKDYSKSITILEGILKSELNNQKHNEIKKYVLLGLVGSYFHQKDYEKAEQYINELIKLCPNNTRYLCELAKILIQKGELSRVIDFCSKIIKLEPNNLNILKWLIEAYFRKEDFKKVVKLCKHVLSLSSEDKFALEYLGSAYGRQNRFEKAEKTYKFLLLIYPKDIHSLINFTLICFWIGKYNKAIEVGLKALHLIQISEPNLKGKSNLYHSIANAYIEVEEYDSAINLLETALDIDYDNEQDNEHIQRKIITDLAHVYRKSAYILFKREKYHESIDLYLKVIKLVQETGLYTSGKSTIFTELGNTYIKVEEYDLAIQSFNSALSIVPYDKVIMKNLAFVFHTKKDFNNAFKICKRALDIDPYDVKIIYHMACLESHRQNTEKSLELLIKAIEISYKYINKAEISDCFDNLRNLKQFKDLIASKTIEFDNFILGLESNNLDSLKNLIEFYYKKEDYKKVVKLCKHVLSFSSEEKFAFENLVLAYINQNLYHKAKDTVKSLLLIYPKDINSLNNLSHICFKRGEYHKAIEVGLEALNLIQNSEHNFEGKSHLYHHIASVYIEIEKYDSAIILLETVLDIEYNNEYDNKQIKMTIISDLADLYERSAYNLFKREKYQESIDLYLKTLKLVQENDTSPIVYGANLFRELGKAYIEIKEDDLAIQSFNSALSIEPKNTAIMNDLAIVFHMKKDFNNAFKICKRALDINPNDTEILFHMVCLESHRQNIENSLDLLKKCIEISPEIYQYKTEFKDCFNNLRDLKKFQDLVVSKPYYTYSYFPFKRTLHE